MWLTSLRRDIDWQQERFLLFGRPVMARRKIAWHGDPDAIYTYSGMRHLPRPWTAALLELKQRAESSAQVGFNSVLLNLYPDGDAAMGWHSDDEPVLGSAPVIASLSFGEQRRFCFRNRLPQTTAKYDIILEHGSLLVMRGATQKNWQHALPKTKKICGPRLNLTFRSVQPSR